MKNQLSTFIILFVAKQVCFTFATNLEFSLKLVPPTFHVDLVASSLIVVKKPAIGHEVPKMVLVPEKLAFKQHIEGSYLLRLRHCASKHC